MLKKDLWKLSASEIVKSTTAGEISVVSIVQSNIDRMHEVNPRLNAVVMDLSEQALVRAEELDKARNSGVETGILHGVPVTVKINVDQIGCPTSNGVSALRDVVAKFDSPVVTNLQKAGAIIIGRTNTPEFSFRGDTDNVLHGRTHNPWGSHVSSGGSSGGAGSAVMSGIGALAHGNDIGGSLRFPAAANGAVTVKPGLGRIPAWNSTQKIERGMLAQSMSVQGLLTRSVGDLDLAMPAIVVSDAHDPFHVPLEYRLGSADGPLRVAFCMETPGFDTHPDVTKALQIAADALKDAGYQVEEKNIPFLEETGNCGFRALMGEVNVMMGKDIREYGSETIQNIFTEYFKYFPPFEGDELIKIMAKRTYYARKWSLFLNDYPLILSPFLPQPFFAPGRDSEGAAGVKDVLGSALWSYSMNFIGQPAGCMPTHIAKLGPTIQPVNVQIIGQRWREDLIVDAMSAIESRVGTVQNQLWAQMDK
jgi:amidase